MNYLSLNRDALRTPLRSALLMIAICCCFYSTTRASADQDSFQPPPTPYLAPERACSALTFEGVSPDIWDCFKAALRQHFGASIPATDSGEISGGGVMADYSWNRGGQTLSIIIKRTPLFVSCRDISNRISDFVNDCHGPEIRLIQREGNRESWRIEGPNVKQRETIYPQIKFRPGDTVSIDAGGCVQTGGRGQTWRRYVDPGGPGSDRLYHGLIRLPGMTAVVRIGDFMKANNYQVPNNARSDLSFHLGYEDDSYPNNGYWGHDNGIDNQCRDVGKAWVNIIITHARR